MKEKDCLKEVKAPAKPKGGKSTFGKLPPVGGCRPSGRIQA